MTGPERTAPRVSQSATRNNQRPRLAQGDDAAIVDRLLKKLRFADPDLSAARARGMRSTPPRISQPIVGPAPFEANWRWPWLWTALSVTLAFAIARWPYASACGVSLAVYAAALGVLLVTGVHAAVLAWKHRRGVAHVISLLVVAVALMSALEIMLPRVGYAKKAAAWVCGFY